VNVPFANLTQLHATLQPGLSEAMMQVVQAGYFVGGAAVQQFETAFAHAIGVRHAVGTGNGTDALVLILKALNLQPTDEVIVPAFGCMPTAEAVTLAGGRVIFADVHPAWFTLDITDVERKITAHTKAVIIVHLFGQGTPLEPFHQLCAKYGLSLIEDCAQAHLTRIGDRYAGSHGVAAAFSFYPTKNLGALGDGGCVVTNNEVLATTIRRLGNHGALQRNDHLIEGMNSRLDTLQAALLMLKLKYLQSWNAERRLIAQKYRQLLQGVPGLLLPDEAPGTEHSYHLYTVRCAQRDELKIFLAGQGIETLIHYPYVIPSLPPYVHQHGHLPFPVATDISLQILSLPLYPGLTDAQIQWVARWVRDFFEGAGR
jgi:dTDP-4-amino-4,6-dideoxygalactose transaminase